MTLIGDESDLLSFETQSWAELYNELSDNSQGHMSIPASAIIEEDKEKLQGDKASRKGKEKDENVVTKGRLTPNHGNHMWTERERRKRMKTMFSTLYSLLPEIPHKADNATIVQETICYIKTLQSTMQMLEKKKLERSMIPKVSYMNNENININKNNNNNNNNNANNFGEASTVVSPVITSTWNSSNVVLNICGNDAQFTVYALKKSGLLTNLCCVIEKHQLEVVSAYISSNVDRCVYMIHARVANANRDQLSKLVNVAEIYKHAAVEMMEWVSS